MKPIRIPPPSSNELTALDSMYRQTRDPRIRTRAQMVLLSIEQGLTPTAIAEIVRESDQTVRTWLKRYLSEGLEGLQDRPRSGAPAKVTAEFQAQLRHVVRQRPRSLGLPFSLWTLHRLADFMAEQTGIRVEGETIRLQLKAADIVLSRPQHKVSSPDPEYEVKKRRLKQPATL